VNTKQAEKEYLTRTGASEWERVKPFSPKGADTLVESARLLRDFAAAMLALEPKPSDLVLDLGAGGCWCSDLLARLNRRSVALDISWEMLQAGRSRPGGSALTAVAGDMERLPFRSGAFDMAVCLNALHHVPDMRAGIREIARVLNDGGVALFSEPGKGHADAAVSTAAMRDFGVLEQEVLIPQFIDACHAAGFSHVRLKSMSYVLPEFDLTPEEWQTWSRAAASKRPMRALGKIGRAIVEMFGLGKQGRLYEEAYGITLVRILREAIEAHPIVVAAKGPLRRRQMYAADIALEEGVARAAPHGAASFRLRLHNRGSATWRGAASVEPGQVTLGVQLLDAQRRLMARDHFRVALLSPVAVDASAVLAFECPMPAEGGTYHLKFDLVAEGVTWFEPAGSQALVHRIDVG
jgi:ubiquinone/menaquinone biosynthesis C-methylase UbiE